MKTLEFAAAVISLSANQERTWPLGKVAEARRLLIRARWPDGQRCPRCNTKGDPEAERAKTPGVFDCPGCPYSFTVRSGTCMGRSRTAYDVWAFALRLFGEGTTGDDLAKELVLEAGISKQTAQGILLRMAGVSTEASSAPLGQFELARRDANKRLRAERGAQQAPEPNVRSSREEIASIAARATREAQSAALQAKSDIARMAEKYAHSASEAASAVSESKTLAVREAARAATYAAQARADRVNTTKSAKATRAVAICSGLALLAILAMRTLTASTRPVAAAAAIEAVPRMELGLTATENGMVLRTLVNSRVVVDTPAPPDADIERTRREHGIFVTDVCREIARGADQ